MAAQSYRQMDAYTGHLPTPPQHSHDQPAGFPAGGEHAASEAHELRDVRRVPLN